MRMSKVVLVALILSMVALPMGAKELVNMEFKQAPLVDVFQILGQLGGYNVLVDPTVQGEVSFILKNLGVEEALDLVTRTTGYRYQLVGNTLVVGSEQRLKTEFGSQDFSFVSVDHVEVAAAQRLVALVAPNVKSYIDNEQNLLVLYGLTTDLELAQRVLRQYDQKSFVASDPILETASETPSEDLASQRVAIFYAEGVELLEQVRQVWPTKELKWDEQSKNIVAKVTKEEWTEIKAFVQERDLPKFLLKGILSTAQETLALVEYRGVTSLLKAGDELNKWEVLNITDGKVEFGQGQRKFTLRMGR